MIPLHVTAAPRVFVQFTGVVTLLFQIALSIPAGATPLTQLAPVSRLLALLALIWSACANGAKREIIKTGKSQTRAHLPDTSRHPFFAASSVFISYDANLNKPAKNSSSQ